MIEVVWEGVHTSVMIVMVEEAMRWSMAPVVHKPVRVVPHETGRRSEMHEVWHSVHGTVPLGHSALALVVHLVHHRLVHHTCKDGPKLFRVDSSFLIAVQFNLLPAGASSHLLSQMVAVWCHDFFLLQRWSCSWYRNVVGVATGDVEGWGWKVVVMNVVHVVHVVLVVHVVHVVHVVNVVVIYDRFRFGSNICDMVIKMIMLFWDNACWFGICASFFTSFCANFCVHLVYLILDVVWHLSFRDLGWPGGVRHVIGG